MEPVYENGFLRPDFRDQILTISLTGLNRALNKYAILVALLIVFVKGRLLRRHGSIYDHYESLVVLMQLLRKVQRTCVS